MRVIFRSILVLDGVNPIFRCL